MVRSTSDRGVDRVVRGAVFRQRTLRLALVVGLLTGTVALPLSFVPLWLDLEEHVGLGLLFTLRGPRPAPEDVVVVGIDNIAADALELPADPIQWPRSFHARVTENLTRAGARAIVFDVFFEQRRGDDDDRFAAAIAEAGNVVLAKFLARESFALGSDSGGSRVEIERLGSPAPIFAEAAAGAAPFPLPKVPVRLNQYWKFAGATADVATLPVVALQVFAADAYDDLVRLLAKLRPGRDLMLPANSRALRSTGHLEAAVVKLRALFASDPRLGLALREAARQEPVANRDVLEALIKMYEGPASEYLNFYGPPGTVRTVRYHLVAGETRSDPALLAIRGKAVVVGLSEYQRAEQRDGFHTVFSLEGLDLSGAEIAATAFANLLHDEPVRPLGLAGHAAVLFAGGVLAAGVCAVLSPAIATLAVLMLSLAYVVLALSQFTAAHIWYPITTPLFFEAPAAFLAVILWRYAETNRERRQMRNVFSRYLPDPVIDDLLRDVDKVETKRRTVYGICLATDAERYTSLAESMDPEELAHLVNRYYAAIFEPIRRHGGTISDVVGDAALAIWTSPAADAALRSRACHAACDISAATARFNSTLKEVQLPTRIGLHSGHLVVGHVGALDHYEYRAVGDIVNTANRIQGLNKRFHTRILVSDDVLFGLTDFLTRRLGMFVLAGKSKPLSIHELICRRDEATDRQRSAVAMFAEGVAAYETRSWHEASKAFRACLNDGNDEAARFYLDACAEHSTRIPDDTWEPVFRMENK